MLLYVYVKLTNLRNKQKLTLLNRCCAGDLYRPSDQLMHVTVSNRISSSNYLITISCRYRAGGLLQKEEKGEGNGESR